MINSVQNTYAAIDYACAWQSKDIDDDNLRTFSKLKFKDSSIWEHFKNKFLFCPFLYSYRKKSKLSTIQLSAIKCTSVRQCLAYGSVPVSIFRILDNVNDVTSCSTYSNVIKETNCSDKIQNINVTTIFNSIFAWNFLLSKF
jgi:hypothetical protein